MKKLARTAIVLMLLPLNWVWAMAQVTVALCLLVALSIADIWTDV